MERSEVREKTLQRGTAKIAVDERCAGKTHPSKRAPSDTKPLETPVLPVEPFDHRIRQCFQITLSPIFSKHDSAIVRSRRNLHNRRGSATIREMAICFKCGSAFPREMRVTRSTECERCNQPVRCCRNCLFFSPGSHWDCRETVPEQVVDKERSNFCEYFRLNERTSTDEKGATSSEMPREATRRAFDDLFS